MQGAYGYRPTYPTTYMPQMYGQQPMIPSAQQQMALAQTTGGYGNYICRPVASEEEARAVPTDFTGATLVLIDGAHNAIYTKSLTPAYITCNPWGNTYGYGGYGNGFSCNSGCC